MQDPPDTDQLLDAIAAFLARDVVGAVADRGLQFRVRIAAHLCAGLAREVRAGPGADRAHLAALQALLGEGAPSEAETSDPRRAIRDAEAALAARLRTTPLDDAEIRRLASGLKRIAADKVRISDPRFDLSDDIE